MIPHRTSQSVFFLESQKKKLKKFNGKVSNSKLKSKSQTALHNHPQLLIKKSNWKLSKY
jgi:hypothetical protein